jgi:arylsulfatase A-like enzyme
VIAESNWTLPSHVTLFSGLPPQFHGVEIPNQAPSPDVPLLAEVLRANGFRTIGLTAGRFLSERYGFGRGFEVFDDGDLALTESLARARREIAEVPTEGRFFAFIHTYDVHCPYHPPPAYAQRFATRPAEDAVPTRGRCGNPHFNRMQLTAGQARYISDRYDGGIRYADDLIGQFLNDLDEQGLLDRTLVVVVSDHGEEFLEHGKIGHRAMLHVQTLRVPWIMAGPGVPASVLNEPAGLADVMPTLLELLDVPAPSMRGRSLVDVLRGRRPVDPDRLLFSENHWGPKLSSAFVRERHVIIDGLRGYAKFFDLASDPAEQVDLAKVPEAKEANLELWFATREYAQGVRASPERHEPVPLADADAEERAQLEALGYVELPEEDSAGPDVQEGPLDR